ncbi:MAG: hypothetical protein LBH00_12040 [Planctomycetaceae bacterium]|nr:hypothetical protein [Planctomycetaceae bacterium]
MQYIGSRYFGDTIAESSNKTADIRIYAEPQYAKKAFEYCLIPDPPIGTSAAIINMARRYELIPHNRFFAEYKNEVIGNFSYERKFGLWEEDPSNYVCFIRGNCLVICTGYFDFDEKTYLPKRCTGSSDPLETAWRIDLYLKTPPVEKLKTEEKQELKTLNITLLSLTQIDVNKEYVLDFPRRTAKGDTPTEIRLVVSSGEIRQVIDLSSDQNKNSVSPPQDQTQRANGRYTVKFFKSGNQTISCYHIDKDGCCTAWGEQTVRVNKEPACLGLKSAKSTATSVIATTDAITVYTVLAAPSGPWNPANTTGDDKQQPWVSALDFAIATANTKEETTPADALAQLTTYLHGGHGMTYDTVSGASGFGMGMAGGAFKLTDYINRTSTTVNCYDQAAALYTLGRILGINVQYVYMQPFGYINEVNLVGVGQCNNPFYNNNDPFFTTDPNPIVDSDWTISEGRSRFGNHAFTVLADSSNTEYVYDACALTIDVVLDTYLSDTIDTSTDAEQKAAGTVTTDKNDGIVTILIP